MKKLLIVLMVVAVSSFLFVGCLGDGIVTPPVDDVDDDEDDGVISDAVAVAAVAVAATAPVDATAFFAALANDAFTGYDVDNNAAYFASVATFRGLATVVAVNNAIVAVNTVVNAIAADAAALTEAAIKGTNADLANVSATLVLMTTGTSGSTITWSATTVNSATIAANGTVTRSGSDNIDDTVVLTATLTKGAVIDTKTFDVTILESKKPVLTSWTMNMNSNGHAKNIVLTFSEDVAKADVDLTLISVDNIGLTGTTVLTGSTKVQTTTSSITIKTMGPAVVTSINGASAILTSIATDYTLVLGAGAFDDLAENASVANVNFGAPTTFAKDSTAPKMTSFTQVTAVTATAVFDDYMVAGAGTFGNWTATGIAAAVTATTLAANSLSVTGITFTTPTAGASYIDCINGGITDIAGTIVNTAFDTASTAGVVTPTVGAPVWTVN